MGAGSQRLCTRGAVAARSRGRTAEHQRRHQDRARWRLSTARARSPQSDPAGRHPRRPRSDSTNGRAAGVDCAGPDGPAVLTADRIVLCAGAIGSAHLLLLSGIGPEAVLAAAGIPVMSNVPVGARTSDHPEWVLPVDWTPTHDLPPVEAILTTPERPGDQAVHAGASARWWRAQATIPPTGRISALR